MRAWLAVLAGAVLTAPANAAGPAPPAWEGVWQGSIGALPVRACLQSGSSWDVGAYYYLSQNKLIRLEHGSAGSWTEHAGVPGKPGGLWQIERRDAGLRGTWQGGGKTLPIVLTLVALGQDDPGTCESRAFLAPRLRPVTERRTAATINRIAVTRIDYHVAPWLKDSVSLRSFAITPRMPGDAAIKKQLRLAPDTPGSEADYRECVSANIVAQGTDGAFDLMNEPYVLRPKFLTVSQQASYFCGGAHPSFESSWRTFDRATGKLLNPARWFGKAGSDDGAAEGAGPLVMPTSALRRVIVRRMTFVAAECREAVAAADYWYTGLTGTGIVFAPSLPHAATACSDAVVVPFAALRPYLNAAGKADLTRLIRGHYTN